MGETGGGAYLARDHQPTDLQGKLGKLDGLTGRAHTSPP